MATAELTVTANLAGLRQQLESIPGITAEQSKLMVAELNKSIKASETAAKRAAAETKRAMQDTEQAAKKAATATADVGDKFGRVGSDAGKLAGALALVNPALGEAARTVADLADVGEVGAGAISGLGLALTGGVAVLATFAAGMMPVVEALEDQAQRAREAAQSLEEYTAASQQAAEAQSALSGLVSSASDQIKVATGLETAREQSARKQAEALREQAAATTALTQDEIDRADALIASNRAELASLELKARTNSLTEEEAAQYRSLQGAVRTATEERGRNQRVIAQTTADAEGLATALMDIAQAEDQAEKNARRKAEADKLAAERAREAANAERDKEAASRAYADMVIGYAESVRQLEQAQLANATAEEKILAQGQERIRQITELEERTKKLALSSAEVAAAEKEAEAARAALTADTQSQIDAIEQAAFDKRMALIDEQRLAETAAAEERAALLTDALGQGFDTVRGLLEEGAAASAEKVAALQQQLEQGAESLTQAEREALKDRVEAQRAAAIRAFEVAKAGKLAEAIINTATAVTANLANPVAAGIVAAIGAAQVATISAEQPAFHSGGMVGGPDQVGARLVAGEGVLSRQGVSSIGGPEAVRAANAGVSSAPVVVAVSQYRHEVFRPFIRDHLRLGGGLADAIRGQRTIGMREAL